MPKAKAVTAQIGPVAAKISQVVPQIDPAAESQIAANVAPIESDVTSIGAEIGAGKPHAMESRVMEKSCVTKPSPAAAPARRGAVGRH